jgi:hypothetical protein
MPNHMITIATLMLNGRSLTTERLYLCNCPLCRKEHDALDLHVLALRRVYCLDDVTPLDKCDLAGHFQDFTCLSLTRGDLAPC